MVKISVIVPVYNVEKYLDECISSICSSSINDIEILLIDDGSTDTSGKKCEEWANKDSRIKVYHKPNGGLSDARNYGLKFAHGEFIAFVDSDDKISPNMLEDLLSSCIRYATQVAICDVWLWNPDLNETKKINDLPHTGIHLIDFSKYSNIYHNTAWRKLYNKSLFDDNTMFPKGIIHEDIGFWWIIMSKIKNISIVNKPLYYYRQNNKNSICAEKNMIRHASDTILSYLYGLDLGLKNIDETRKQEYLNAFTRQYLINTDTSAINKDAIKANNNILRKIKKNVKNQPPEIKKLYLSHNDINVYKLISIRLFSEMKNKLYFKIKFLNLILIEFHFGGL